MAFCYKVEGFLINFAWFSRIFLQNHRNRIFKTYFVACEKQEKPS